MTKYQSSIKTSMQKVTYSLGVLIFVIGLVAYALIACAAFDESKGQHAVPVSLNQKKGMHLHDQIIAIATKSTNQKLDEVSKIMESTLLESIPIGTSFDDAEEILRSAGFQVSPRNVSHPLKPGEYEDRLFAYLGKIAESGTIFKVSENLYVYLFPKVPGQYDRVFQLKAHVDSPMP